MLYKRHYRSKIKLCPHCNEKKIARKSVCPNCGFDESKKDEVVENLRFGLDDKLISLKKDDNTKKYSQQKTKSISIVNKINTILMFLVGIVSMSMLFIPLFSSDNVCTHLLEIKEVYGYPPISEFLIVDKTTNIISLIKGVIGCTTNYQVYDITSAALLIYELSTIVFILIIALFGLLILIMAIRDLFFNKTFYKYKTLLGINLTLLLLLLFAFGCYGFYVMFSIFISISAFIILYINGILSKEKAFLIKNLIHKSICGFLLLTLLTLSSVGLVTLNVDVGADLFNGEVIQSGSAVVSPKLFLCNGLFLELAQFIQRASGDDYYTTTAFIFNLCCLVSHVIYLAFISMALVSLLKSLSNQNVRFPIKYIVVSTISFYCFAFFTIAFNSIVNEASYQNYINALTINLASNDPNKYVYNVFNINFGMWVSIILNLPTCIYCSIAKKTCLRRTYY